MKILLKVVQFAVIPILELTLKYGGTFNKAHKCPHCGKFHK